MPSGRMSNTIITASTWNTIYTVPAGKVGSITISIVNTGTTAADFRLAITAAATPSLSEHIEFGAIVPPKGVYERSGLVLSANQKIVAFTIFGETLATNVYGYEDDAV